MKASAKTTGTITIDGQACKGCHLCVDQCPENVLEVSGVRNAKGYVMPSPTAIDKCIRCLLCEMICPDLAITVEVAEDEK